MSRANHAPRVASDAAIAAMLRLRVDVAVGWRYSHAPNADDESEYLRFWYVMPDGSTGRIPGFSIEGLGLRFSKDSYITTVATWCAVYKPDAIVFAAEMWAATIKGEEAARRIQRAFPHGMPPMQVPDTRHRLREEFGVECTERLTVLVQAHGFRDLVSTHELLDRPDGSRGYSPTCNGNEEGASYRFRWNGILDGKLAISDVGPGTWREIERRMKAPASSEAKGGVS